MVKRYYCLDVAKFAFTLMIAVYHFLGYYGQNARGGFIAVEFFFITSGFLTMHKMENKGADITPEAYTWHRIKYFYPHYIFSFMVIFLYLCLQRGDSFGGMIRNLCSQYAEILILHGTLLVDNDTYLYNSMSWYISSLLIVGYILWGILRKHKETVLWTAPVISLWLYTFIVYSLGWTSAFRPHVFSILNYGFLRGTAGLLAGIVAYRLYKYFLLEHKFDKILAGGVLGALLLIVAFAASYKWYHRSCLLYIILFVFGIALLAAYEEKRRHINCSLFHILPSLSYAVYLNHYIVFRVMKDFLFHDFGLIVVPAYLGILLVYSMFTSWFVKQLGQWSKSFLGCIKKQMSVRQQN